MLKKINGENIAPYRYYKPILGDIDVVYTDIKSDGEIYVYCEQPDDIYSFKTLLVRLSDLEVLDVYGFSPEEIQKIIREYEKEKNTIEIMTNPKSEFYHYSMRRRNQFLFVAPIASQLLFTVFDTYDVGIINLSYLIKTNELFKPLVNCNVINSVKYSKTKIWFDGGIQLLFDDIDYSICESYEEGRNIYISSKDFDEKVLAKLDKIAERCKRRRYDYSFLKNETLK